MNIESGNYSFDVELNIPWQLGNLPLEIKLLKAGLRWELERGGLSEAWKEVVGVAGKRGGKVLPDGFKRDSVEFAEDKAEVMQEAVMAWADGEGMDLLCKVSEYVKGEQGEAMKQAKAYLAKARESGKMAKLEAILEVEDIEAMPDSEIVALIHKEMFAKK